MIPAYRFSESISIVNVGDVHRGNNNCDVNLLNKIINYIKDNKHVYWISTGDMLETALKSSKSSVYEASTVQEELDALTAELEPIRSKCLGFVASNHQDRVKRETGLSLDKALAKSVMIPFLGITAIIKITCGRASYFLNLHHGVGGGTAGNKVNRAMRLARNIPGCDVYFTGHTHSFSYVQDTHTAVDRKRCKLTEITTHHVCTGHYIIYGGSYAESMGLRPKPRGSAIVHLGACDTGNQANKSVSVDFLS